MSRKKSKKQDNIKEIEAFAAFDHRLNMLYATIKPTKEEAETLMRRYNPPVDEETYTYRVYPIRVTIDLGKQHDLFAEDEEK
tara:strand:- start:1223 stop:1468 length:246 start_codon:yes stop_codon:yes gene_type:complete